HEWSHQRECAVQPAADPGSPDATDDVETFTELGRVTGVTLDEPDGALDSELGGPCPRVREIWAVNVDADTADTEVSREQAEHLALSTGEVQHPRALSQTTDVTEQQQIVERQRIHDPMGGLGDLVVPQDAHHGGTFVQSLRRHPDALAPDAPAWRTSRSGRGG